MREIKFRVYCEFEVDGILHKSMESPASWFLLTQTGKLWTHDPLEKPHPLEKEYKKAIPLFYTGLKDKNGKEIYEGDVVGGSGVSFSTTSSVVYFGCDGAQVEIGDHRVQLSDFREREIIGDIHENPELLENK